MAVRPFDRQEQTIAALVDGTDNLRVAGVIVEGLAQSGNTPGQDVVRNENVRPHRGNQLVSIHDTGVFGEVDEHLHGLGLDTHASPGAGDLIQRGTNQPVTNFKIACQPVSPGNIIASGIPAAQDYLKQDYLKLNYLELDYLDQE